MSLIRNIAGFVAGAGYGGVGTDVFISDMPANPANALMFLTAVSPAPSVYLNTQTQDFELWVRNSSTKTGGDIQEEVLNLLHQYHHLQLGDYYIYLIVALGNIEDYGKDTENRSLQKVTYRAIYKDGRTVS